MRTRRCLLTVSLLCLFPALRLTAATEFPGPIALSRGSSGPSMSVPAASKGFPSLSSPLSQLYLSWQENPIRTAAEATPHPGLHVAADEAVLVWVLQDAGELTSSVDVDALEQIGDEWPVSRTTSWRHGYLLPLCLE